MTKKTAAGDAAASGGKGEDVASIDRVHLDFGGSPAVKPDRQNKHFTTTLPPPPLPPGHHRTSECTLEVQDAQR